MIRAKGMNWWYRCSYFCEWQRLVGVEGCVTSLDSRHFFAVCDSGREAGSSGAPTSAVTLLTQLTFFHLPRCAQKVRISIFNAFHHDDPRSSLQNEVR